MPASIRTNIFNNLLDKLVNDFIKNDVARFSGLDFEKFGISQARDFFSILVEYRTLEGELANEDVIAVLCDDSKHSPPKISYTFIIFINEKLRKIQKDYLSLLLAHEICHFAFYYELFCNCGGERSNNTYNAFKAKLSEMFEEQIDAIINPDEQIQVDNLSLPNNNVNELINMFMNYPPEHFARNCETRIDYNDLFKQLCKHQKLI